MSAKSGVVQGAAIVIADPLNPFNVLQPNADGSINTGAPTLTPSGATTPNALVLQQGNASQQLFAKNEIVHGAIVTNPAIAADEGIAASEEIWIDITGIAAVIGGGGTALPFLPGSSLVIPGPLTTSVNWIATTVGHKICAVKY